MRSIKGIALAFGMVDIALTESDDVLVTTLVWVYSCNALMLSSSGGAGRGWLRSRIHALGNSAAFA